MLIFGAKKGIQWQLVMDNDHKCEQKYRYMTVKKT